MVKVYLNPGKLDERLAAIDKFSESVRTAYRNIQNYYTNDPIEGREDLRFCMDRFVSEGDDLIIHIQKIKDIKTKIEQLNSSGVATIDADGRITLEAPDDSVESPEKFQMWSQGYLDASDLSAGKSPLPSGRSIDEVRESMKSHKDDSTYANTFIDRVGPENLTKIGDKNANNNKEAPVIGEILATASQTWDKEKSQKNADLILGSLKVEPLVDSRVPVFTRMMGLHDKDGNGANDLKFGTSFLVSLGQGAEAKAPNWPPNSKPDRYKVFAPEFDPLFGVIDAMSGNEEAARTFLAPNGGNEGDVQRVKKIMDRHEIGDNSWTDTWTSISSITSEAHGADHYDGTDGGGSASKQAAAIATSVVNGIGEPIMKNKGYDSISGAARSNLRKTVSCYPYVFDKIATGTGDPASMQPEKPDQADGAWSKGIGFQPKFTVAGLAGETQTISRDENEFKALTDSVGELEKNNDARYSQ